MSSGTLNVKAGDDGIHADVNLTIEDGDITLDGAEGLEATNIVINGGTVTASGGTYGIEKRTVLIDNGNKRSTKVR